MSKSLLHIKVLLLLLLFVCNDSSANTDSTQVNVVVNSSNIDSITNHIKVMDLFSVDDKYMFKLIDAYYTYCYETKDYENLNIFLSYAGDFLNSRGANAYSIYLISQFVDHVPTNSVKEHEYQLNLLRLLAIAHEHSGNLQSTIKVFTRIINMADSINAYNLSSRVRNQLAYLYLTYNEVNTSFGEVETLLMQALELAKCHEEAEESIPYIYSNLSYLYAKDYDRASQYHDLALEQFPSNTLADAATRLGIKSEFFQIQFKNDKFDLIRDEIDEYIELSAKNKNVYFGFYVDFQILKAKILINDDKYDQAEEVLKEVFLDIDGHGLRLKEHTVTNDLIELYSKKNRVNELNQYLIKALELSRRKSNKTINFVKEINRFSNALTAKNQELADEKIRIESEKRKNSVLKTMIMFTMLFLALFIFGYVKNKKHNIKLSNAYKLLKHKKNEVEMINEKLEKSQIELETTNINLTHFTNVLVHDIKTPIKTMRQYSQLISTRYSEVIAAKDKIFFDYIIDSSKQLSAIVGSVLDYYKLKEINYSVEYIDMGLIFEEILEEQKIAFEDKNLEVKLYGSFPKVVSNKEMLYNLFNKIIENAFRYSKKDNNVRLEIESTVQDKEWLVFRLKDFGTGIKASSVPHVFELFNRLDKVIDNDSQGMGLTACKRTVDFLNGEIEIQSEYNAWTEVIVRLPIKIMAEFEPIMQQLSKVAS